MKILPLSFYTRSDVLVIARELLGKRLVTRFADGVTSGRIVEVEAYAGMDDRASHAWKGRRTARNEMMYARGGCAYVYLCYGIHHLFNVVTHDREVPHAILIRGLEPLEGTELMARRTGKKADDPALARGPGNLTKALGITVQHNGLSLLRGPVVIADDGFQFPSASVALSPRIGVDYAGQDAGLPYRFYIRHHLSVSGRRD